MVNYILFTVAWTYSGIEPWNRLRSFTQTFTNSQFYPLISLDLPPIVSLGPCYSPLTPMISLYSDLHQKTFVSKMYGTMCLLFEANVLGQQQHSSLAKHSLEPHRFLCVLMCLCCTSLSFVDISSGREEPGSVNVTFFVFLCRAVWHSLNKNPSKCYKHLRRSAKCLRWQNPYKYPPKSMDCFCSFIKP